MTLGRRECAGRSTRSASCAGFGRKYYGNEVWTGSTRYRERTVGTGRHPSRGARGHQRLPYLPAVAAVMLIGCAGLSSPAVGAPASRRTGQTDSARGAAPPVSLLLARPSDQSAAVATAPAGNDSPQSYGPASAPGGHGRGADPGAGASGGEGAGGAPGAGAGRPGLRGAGPPGLDGAGPPGLDGAGPPGMRDAGPPGLSGSAGDGPGSPSATGGGTPRAGGGSTHPDASTPAATSGSGGAAPPAALRRRAGSPAPPTRTFLLVPSCGKRCLAVSGYCHHRRRILSTRPSGLSSHRPGCRHARHASSPAQGLPGGSPRGTRASARPR